MKIAGFDWDDGNWPKCGKHDVSRAEIEQVLLGEPAVMADPHPGEPRMRAISAGYMHQKEIDHYEQQK